MDDAAGRLARHERQAVMARVDPEEAQPSRRAVGGPADQLWWQPHRVAKPEAKDVAVKVQRLHVVASGQHHVAETLLLRDEFVPVRAGDATVLQRRAMKDLEAVAGGILEPDHLVDATVGKLSGSGLLVGRALHIEP